MKALSLGATPDSNLIGLSSHHLNFRPFGLATLAACQGFKPKPAPPVIGLLPARRCMVDATVLAPLMKIP